MPINVLHDSICGLRDSLCRPIDTWICSSENYLSSGILGCRQYGYVDTVKFFIVMSMVVGVKKSRISKIQTDSAPDGARPSSRSASQWHLQLE
jgi:hypothetical protein